MKGPDAAPGDIRPEAVFGGFEHRGRPVALLFFADRIEMRQAPGPTARVFLPFFAIAWLAGAYLADASGVAWLALAPGLPATAVISWGAVRFGSRQRAARTTVASLADQPVRFVWARDERPRFGRRLHMPYTKGELELNAHPMVQQALQAWWRGRVGGGVVRDAA